jgi:Fe2+ transport system protein FeoA
MFVLSHGKSPVTSVEGLDLVEAGQRVRIIQVELRQSIHYKLADMGITPGAEVLVQEKAPFGGPILIRIRGTMLALRPSEASCILVGPIGS